MASRLTRNLAPRCVRPKTVPGTLGCGESTRCLALQVRAFTGSRTSLHGGHGHSHGDHDHELVEVAKPGDKQPADAAVLHTDAGDDEDEDEMEDMVAIGPSGKEYGGPMRGGKFKEPTRFGDWERKGRCSDF